MDKKIRIFLMSGTHWDREWYKSFQGFRYRLVEMVDDLMEKLECFPEMDFVFDGQTIVLEDYLEIAPENRDRLEKYIRDGRIFVGPWYDMPDEFLLSGESLIRNLQIGHGIAAKFGVQPMKNGYICDIFGHSAQTPQIFAGFGIYNCVLGRGTNESTTPAHFLWEAPDGTQCVAFKLPDSCGYGDFYRRVVSRWREDLPDEEKDRMLREYVDREAGRSDIPVVLLMDGLDHEPMHAELQEITERLRRLSPGCGAKVGSLECFSEEINGFAARMPVKKGELNEPAKEFAEYIHLIPNTVSSRYDLKYRNDRCQTLMEKWTQPVTAAVNLYGGKIRKSYGDLAYRYLIQNHPHDSICGCSIDQVHRDMGYRFDQCAEISETVLDSAAKLYRNSLKPDGHGTYVLSVFNPLPYERKELITVNAVLPDFATTRKEPFGYETVNNFRLLDSNGEEIPYTLLTNVKNTKAQDPYGPGDVQAVSFRAELAAAGVTEFSLQPAEYPERFFRSLRTSQTGAENEFLTLKILPDGTAELFDKISSVMYRNLLTFTDSADIGDGWFQCPPVEDRVCLSAGSPVSISVESDGPSECTFRVVREMKVPRSIERFDREMPRLKRSEETAVLRITSDLTLAAGERFVRVCTYVDNSIRDHRLKMNFETGIAGDYFASESFCFVRRKCGRDRATENWKESDRLEKPFSGIVGKRGDDRGLAMVSAYGLHECAAENDKAGTLSVTLLRCFERTVNTDFEQDGELPGRWEYSFLLMPLDNTVKMTDLQRAQDCLAAGVRSLTTKAAGATALRKHSFLRSDFFCFSTAKFPESGEDNTLIVRLYNPEKETVCGVVTFDRDILRAERVTLNEEPLDEVDHTDRDVLVELGPWKIGTYQILFR